MPAFKKPLEQVSILWTRPSGQGRDLVQRLEQLGASIIEFPTLEIHPIFCDSEAFLGSNSLCIWTSANAVDCTPQKIIDSFTVRTTHIPMGEGTSRALEKRGLHSSWVPARGTTSESFLIEFQKKVPLDFIKDIWVFTGKAGRGILAAGLEKLGLRVKQVIVYERVLPHIAQPESLLENWLSGMSISIVTSLQSFEHLLCLAPKLYHSSILRQAMVVVSKRIEACVSAGGARQALLARSANTIDILEAIQAWRKV